MNRKLCASFPSVIQYHLWQDAEFPVVWKSRTLLKHPIRGRPNMAILDEYLAYDAGARYVVTV
ncbi:hypothetical protein [Bifidobacterium psychraerophilum]|uniref:hypothetical protein n=1 Tax=Bifidobacterium psychraerophilum TaxID=218140 RepID=UPI0012E05124|nr:hypothetical protein [Bifidobacterium psychraerophilum]